MREQPFAAAKLTARDRATLRPGAEPPRRTAALAVNGDGLLDVTDLVA